MFIQHLTKVFILLRDCQEIKRLLIWTSTDQHWLSLVVQFAHRLWTASQGAARTMGEEWSRMVFESGNRKVEIIACLTTSWSMKQPSTPESTRKLRGREFFESEKGGKKHYPRLCKTGKNSICHHSHMQASLSFWAYWAGGNEVAWFPTAQAHLNGRSSLLETADTNGSPKADTRNEQALE